MLALMLMLRWSVLTRMLGFVMGMLAAVTSPALAQDVYEKATAQELFKRAMEAMKAGEYAKACPLLEKTIEASETGMVARFHLGKCYEHLGRTVSAWKQFREVLEAAQAAASKCKDEKCKADMLARAKVAGESRQAIETKLIKIAIKVSTEVAALPDFQIRRDGEVVEKADYGTGYPVEKGKHTVQATATGYKPWLTEVDLNTPGETASVHVPMLTPIIIDPRFEPEPEGSIQGPVGLIVGGGGIVIMGVGGIVGLVAMGQYGDSDEHCRGDGCTPVGIKIREDARGVGVIGTALVAIGGAATIAGLVVWLTAPSDKPADDKKEPAKTGASLRLGVRPTAAGVQWGLEGSW